MKRTHSSTTSDRPRPRRPLMERLLPLFTDKAVAMVALLVALVFLFALLNTATAEEEPVTKCVLVEAGSCLNIRTHPKAHAEVTLRMERGEELKVHSVGADGWARVDRFGDSGYCRVEYLCDALPEREMEYITAVDKLRVRALPSAKATTVKKLKKGRQVTVLSFLTIEGIQWARVKGGYIMAEYLDTEGA